MTVVFWSFGALFTGFALDMIFGDPHGFPHIARGIGRLISALEKYLRRLFPKTVRGETAAGILFACAVLIVCTGVPFAALYLGYHFFMPLGYIIESFLCWQLLAVKSLKTESMKVYDNLRADDIEGARENVSMIVGRDTAALDREGVTRAAVETVAENASDGVTAPLLYIMLGGAALGCLYKAVNTMDSMVGYKNERYLHFGRAAAKMDDVLNFIPSRLCALLMIAGAYLLRFDGKNALRIWRRDRRCHASPNSAQTESVCAGALGVRLAGPASYFGVIHDKPHIGDDARP
ncbi:MAG: adenosylcobinamide-phosphate synthase CbiB, partial [Defluviitaleaceae bacterium]|nr:adenosylcobinamide-phosphate synthase CbiB [Defluviitaleaceae bacterium]